MKGFLTVLALVCASLIVAGCGGKKDSPAPSAAGKPAGTADKRLTLAVIPKGTTHVFWKSVEAGALKAGEELGVDIRWKGPIKENDRAQQIQVVQQFISEGVDAIVLAPLDEEALQGVCREAMDRGIPVVIFDSALKGEPGRDFVSFVATDNRQGGRMGGEELVRLMNGSGNVVLLRYQVGSASTDNREEGFLGALREKAGMNVISDTQYGGPTVGDAISVTENILDQLRQAQGVFAPNESTTVGLLTTLQRHNLAGKVRFVGFDASQALIEGLTAGEIDGLVVQNPRKMGYLGVKTAVAAVRKEPFEPRYDTGVTLVTRANLATPEIQELLK